MSTVPDLPLSVLMVQLAEPCCTGVWWQAIHQLAGYRVRVVPELIAACADPNAQVRRGAVLALGEIGPAARPAAPTLFNLLGDSDHGVCNDAGRVLALLASPMRPRVPLLLERLAVEDNSAMRVSLITLLGLAGPRAREALPQIVVALDDPFFFPRVLLALRQIAPGDAHLLDLLADQLTTVGAPFRALAAETVGKLRLEGSMWREALERAALCADRQTRHAARNALAKLRATRDPHIWQQSSRPRRHPPVCGADPR